MEARLKGEFRKEEMTNERRNDEENRMRTKKSRRKATGLKGYKKKEKEDKNGAYKMKIRS